MMSQFQKKFVTCYFIFTCFNISFYCLEPWNPLAYKAFSELSNDLTLTNNCCYDSPNVITASCVACNKTYSPRSITSSYTTTIFSYSTTNSPPSSSFSKTLYKSKAVYLLRPIALLNSKKSFKKKTTLTSDKVNNILKNGENLSKLATAIATAPVVYVTSKVSLAASKMPALLAAKGALIGTAISTPVQIMSTLISGVKSAIIGKIVTVPFALGANIGASFLTFKDKIQKVKVYLGKGMNYVRNNGQNLLLQPIGILKGAKKASVGSILSFNGIKLKALGKMVIRLGDALTKQSKPFVTSGITAINNGFKNLKNTLHPKMTDDELVLCVEEQNNNNTITESFYSFESNPSDLFDNQEKKVTSIDQNLNTLTSWSFVPLETKND